jgi:hypothetical protein
MVASDREIEVHGAKEKGLTVKQKALAEKVLKLRYNGLIRAIKAVANTQATEAKIITLPDLPYNEQDTYRNADGVTEWTKTRAMMPPDILMVANKAQNDVTYCRKLVEAHNSTVREKLEKVTKSITKLETQLKVERDEKILELHFANASEALETFREGLITPEQVMARLMDMGVSISEALPIPTGVGVPGLPQSVDYGDYHQ